MYQKITQEADGQLFGWRFTEARYEGAEIDFDVLNDYTVYMYDGVYVAEYVPTGLAYGTFATVEWALECIKERIQEKQETTEKIEASAEKFDEVVKNNSLDERYKDIEPVKKRLTNEELRKKYSKHTRNAELFANAGMKLSAKINADYFGRLLDH